MIFKWGYLFIFISDFSTDPIKEKPELQLQKKIREKSKSIQISNVIQNHLKENDFLTME